MKHDNNIQVASWGKGPFDEEIVKVHDFFHFPSYNTITSVMDGKDKRMSIVVGAFNSSGAAIASDSREIDWNGELVSDNAKKVFAYGNTIVGIAGLMSFQDHDSTVRVEDIVDKVIKKNYNEPVDFVREYGKYLSEHYDADAIYEKETSSFIIAVKTKDLFRMNSFTIGKNIFEDALSDGSWKGYGMFCAGIIDTFPCKRINFLSDISNIGKSELEARVKRIVTDIIEVENFYKKRSYLKEAVVGGLVQSAIL